MREMGSPFDGFGSPFGIGHNGGSGYTAEAEAFFAARATVLDDASDPGGVLRGQYNDVFVALIAQGLWPFIRWLSLMCVDDAQAARINMKDPSQVATAVNSPTFVVDRGYEGDGATSYLSSGVSSSVIDIDNCSLFAFADVAASARTPLVAWSGVGYLIHGGGLAAAARLRCGVVSASTTLSASDQFVAASKDGVNQRIQIENTNEDLDVVTNSNSTADIRFLANNGTSFSNGRMLMAGFGDYMSTAQLAALNTIVRSFGTLRGAI